MAVGPCLCGDTGCPSCGPAQGHDINPEDDLCPYCERGDCDECEGCGGPECRCKCDEPEEEQCSMCNGTSKPANHEVSCPAVLQAQFVRALKDSASLGDVVQAIDRLTKAVDNLDRTFQSLTYEGSLAVHDCSR